MRTSVLNGLAGSVLSDVAKQGFSTAIARIEVRSALSPPYTIDVSDALKPADPNAPLTPGQRLAKYLQPAVILRGGIGTQTIAPYGLPDVTAWRRNLILLGAAVAGIGAVVAMAIFGVGLFTGKRRR